MTDREKLIELVMNCDKEFDILECYNGRPRRITAASILVDYLLANGVTIPTRCKECRYKFAVNGHNKEGCPLDGTGLMHDDDFCSCGDERGEVND